MGMRSSADDNDAAALRGISFKRYLRCKNRSDEGRAA
jgi:hypothetical protein